MGDVVGARTWSLATCHLLQSSLPILPCASGELDRFDMSFAAFLDRGTPDCLQESQEALGGDVFSSVGDCPLEVLGTGPVAACWDLVVTVLLEYLVCICISDGIREGFSVIPVALEHGFRHSAVEVIGVMPDVVLPAPGVRFLLFDLLDEKLQVVPPQVVLTHHRLGVVALVFCSLPIHS